MAENIVLTNKYKIMNREIKFQFIIDGNKLSRSYTLQEIMDRDMENILDDMENCDCQLNESNNHCEGDCLKYENSIITGNRQYTHLRDRNGKEVWEGDIVKTNYGKIGEIVYHSERATFIIRDENNFNVQLFNDVFECEIIGNIYENTDLLKV